MVSSGVQKGFALVMVLWFVTLLSILALGMSKSTRTDTAITRNLLEGIQARHLADAAIERAIINLLDPEPEDQEANLSGISGEFRFHRAELSYSALSEQGKVDINQAPAELLQGLLTALGADQEQTDAIADAIIDWRDENDLRLLNGAEQTEYQQAGLQVKPSNAPFRSIAELQQVMGIDKALYQKLAAHVTVHSASDKINPQVAPREVLLAIPGVDIAEVEALLDARAAEQEDETVLGPLPILSGVDDWVSDALGNVYSIRGTASLPSGATHSREVTVLITGDNEVAYYLLDARPAFASRENGETAQ